jgi:hypothetical protein
MDCEKCEELMLDELYGELDDVTSALVRRHVASCSRCNAMLADLRGTREAISAAHIVEDAPPSLEDRIFAAEKEARKVVPLRSRTSTFISIAGRWAMRPQTAMAALFLLMIGSTTFLLKGRAPQARSADITVAQEGAPVAATPAANGETLGPNAARNAHGPLEPSLATPPPAAAPMATAAASGALALADDSPKDLGKGDSLDPSSYPSKAARPSARSAAGLDRDEEDKKTILNAGAPGGAPPPSPASPPAAAAYGAGPAAGGGGSAGMAQQAASESGNSYGKKESQGDDFAQGMTAYRGRQFPQATQSFDRASQGGDLNASLWAARAVRDGQGCGAAVARYDSVSQRGGTSYVGADATLEGAQCYAQLGSTDVARAKYTQLLAVPSHAARAQQALDSLNQVATRKSAAPSPAKPKAAATTPQAAPPANAKPAQTGNAVPGNSDNGL